MATQNNLQHKSAPKAQRKTAHPLSAAAATVATAQTIQLPAFSLPEQHPTLRTPSPRRAPLRRKEPVSQSAPNAALAGAEDFLRLLSATADIATALKKSGADSDYIYTLLLSNPDFRARFDDRANLKLELSALDIALRGNASLSSFLLTNRLGERYRKGSVAPKTSQPPQIVFIGPGQKEDESED